MSLEDSSLQLRPKSIIFFQSLQSLNVVESPELRSLFRMLREELRDSDIPRRTHIRTRVAEVWDEHVAKLEREMSVCFSFNFI